MRKTVAILALTLLASQVHAAAVPRNAGYDARMQQVAYNPNNMTVITAKTGYLTTLVFADDEAVVNQPKTGFDAGWDVSFDSNLVYVMPRPVVQEQQNADGQKEKKVFEPIPAQWRTNLIVRTTKHIYSVQLNMLDDKSSDQNMSYVVSYTYPIEAAQKQRAESIARQKEIQADREKQAISQRFESSDAPKNWDYAMRVGKDSRNIAPDFAYDNGVMTYIGFNNLKTFPAPELYKNGKETVPAFHVETKGKYKIMVVHTVNEKLVLRYGKAVVGIVNQGYGKVRVAPNDTLSPDVKRVEVTQ